MAEALNFFGDSILTPEGNSIFLSTNALREEDSDLGNEIGNAYNLSGNPAIPAFDLESELNLPDGFLSPDVNNFVEAFEGGAIQKRFNFPRNFVYNFGWTFYSNDERREILDPITSEIIDASDYAFLLLKQIEINEVTQEETETIIDFVRLISVNSAEDTGFFNSSNTAGGVRERLDFDFVPVIERPFVREISGVYDLQIPKKGIYDLSFGVLDVDDFGDSTTAMAIWERDFTDNPFQKQEDPEKNRFLTRLKEDGPRHYEGEFQRLGLLRDGEHDGRPTGSRSGDDTKSSPYVFSEQVDDEDGLFLTDEGLEVIFNISRFGDHPYLLRVWTDLNENKCYDHPEHPDSTCRDTNNPDGELVIDDLLTLNPYVNPNDPDIEMLAPGLFKKIYRNVAVNITSTARLTYNSLIPDVRHWNPDTLPNTYHEYVPQEDALFQTIGHGVQENIYITTPESSTNLGILAIGFTGFGKFFSSCLKKKSNQNQTRK